MYPTARFGTSSDSGSESVEVMPAGRNTLLANVVVVRLSAHRFDERAEQDEAVVRVLVARARARSLSPRAP